MFELVEETLNEVLRWSRPFGQFGGRVKLGSGCCQAASVSVVSIPCLSIGMETGPPIGVQKGLLWRRFVPVVYRRDPRVAERSTGDWRGGAWEVPVNSPVQDAEDVVKAGS